MTPITKQAWATLACWMLAAGLVCAQASLPKPTGRVNDFAGLLSAPARAALEQRLQGVETKTSSEIAVATVRSLGGMSVEEYANRLFKEWGVGQAKTDNGVLILVAPNDREMRIEVGYGLEGVLPDGLAGEIRDQQFLPRFRDDDYAGGINAGVNRIADIVEKNQVLTPEELARFNESSADPPVWVLVGFQSLFVAIGAFMVGLGFRAKAVLPILVGVAFSSMAGSISVLWLFTTPHVALATLWAVVALGAYRLGGRLKWRDTFRSGKGGGGTGWVMGGGGSSGSGSGSGGSSSSGGSFGGGSSGGGGASGRW